MLGKLRIETNGNAVAKGWTILLDDKDISKFVRGINIKAGVGELPHVLLDVVAILELSDELQAVIDASQATAQAEEITDVTSVQDEVKCYLPPQRINP